MYYSNEKVDHQVLVVVKTVVRIDTCYDAALPRYLR